MSRKVGFLLAVLMMVSTGCFTDNVGRTSKSIQTSKYEVYVPAEIDYNKKYPLIIAFSPGANARGMVNLWKDISDKYNWIIFASKRFRNGLYFSTIMPQVYSDLKEILSTLPVDESKEIATGFSGGGMGAHSFSFFYPELISAVVVNTGMMQVSFTGAKEQYPRDKFVVFLASPTDFRYDEMKRDRKFLEGLGWEIKWIEFKGGHRIAPGPVYKEAAEWLKQELDL